MQDCLSFGDFTIDRADERLIGPQGPVRLGNKAFQVLLQLAEQEGRLLTKDALFSSVWDGTIVGESALTSVIKELRRALGDESRTPRYIESVYGRGYRFISPVAAAPPIKAAAPTETAAAPAEGKPPVIVVSPFNDDSIRARHPHIATGLREEVLSGLSRFRGIQLVADNRQESEVSASAHRASPRDYQLTTTLLPEGDGIKIIARAKRLADGRIVWAETMSLADTGLAAGVERIVRRIIGAALPAVDEDLFLGLPHDSDGAYDRYFKAKRRFHTAKTFGEAKSAAVDLENIISERPDFGLAYPPLVRLYNTDFGYTGLGSTGPAERTKALALAKAGLVADRGNVHAYTVLGFCHLWHEEREHAREFFEQALALNPYNPTRLNEVAAGMIYLGDFERVRALLDMSLHLQSMPDDSYYEDHARLCLLENQPERVIALVRKMAGERLWPSFYGALCESLAEGNGDPAKLAAWRSRVSSKWIAPPGPGQDELERWIAFHHPLAPDLKERFMAMVRRGFSRLGDADAAGDGHPRPRPKARPRIPPPEPA